MRAALTLILKSAALVAVIAAGLALSVYAAGHPGLQSFLEGYGYAGLFVASLISGFNVLVPVPVAALLPALTVSGLDLWTCLLIMTLGMTIADTASFFAGRLGREIVHGGSAKALRRIERIRSVHAWAPMLAMLAWASFAPLPNEVLAVPLGFMGFRARHIVPAMAFGNMVFNVLFGLGIFTVYTAI